MSCSTMKRRPLLIGLAAFVGAGCTTATAIPARDPSVTISSLSIDAAGVRPHDSLTLLAAYELNSGDRRFGGFSALETDGSLLWLLSDRGSLWRARLTLDAATGTLTLDDWRVGAVLPDRDDTDELDSEALALLPDGTLIAAFEHDDSLRRLVPLADGDWRTERLHAGRLIEGAPRNQGLEALTDWADGSLLAISEGARGPNDTVLGARLAAGAVQPFTYLAGPGFSPVGAARTGDTLLVLERSIGLLSGWQSRLTRQTIDALPIAGTLEGEELLRIQAGPLAENYEGIAVLERPDQPPLVLIVSDDNQSALQRTLLLIFRYAG